MATTFVTGGTGFIGSEVVRELVAERHDVLMLVRSAQGARAARLAGATPVMGDLLEKGVWRDEAASAEFVFHLGSPSAFDERLTKRRAREIARIRTAVDRNLLDAVAGGRARRVVYVSGVSYYGPSGGHAALTEDATPKPYALGRLLVDAAGLVDRHLVMGVPIVSAFPGLVYGNGSWFAQHIVRPVVAGRRLFQIGRSGPLVSPIHVRDCARALVHLAHHGKAGGRYFVVNNEPTRLENMARQLARMVDRPLRVVSAPKFAAAWLVGSLLAEYQQHDAVFSNARLRSLGFRFRYPTIEDGLREIVGGLHV